MCSCHRDNNILTWKLQEEKNEIFVFKVDQKQCYNLPLSNICWHNIDLLFQFFHNKSRQKAFVNQPTVICLSFGSWKPVQWILPICFIKMRVLYQEASIPWIKYHEVPQGGHMFMLVDRWTNWILKALLVEKRPQLLTVDPFSKSWELQLQTTI